MTKLHIIYDISQFGISIFSPLNKAGIHRVTFETAVSLSENSSVQLYFFASTGNYYQCKQFLKNEILFKNIILLIPEMSKAGCLSFHFCYFMEMLLFKINYYFKIINAPFLKKSLYRINKLHAKITSHLSSFHFKKIYYDKIIPSGNKIIYFSPVHPVPNKIKSDKNIIPFVMIYDLIPVLFPHYFLKSTKIKKGLAWYHTFFQSIDKQTGIISISDNTKRDLLNFRKDISPKKIHVCYPGISSSFFQCLSSDKIQETRTKYHIPENGKYILSIATLEPRKNLSSAVKYFINFLKLNPKIDDLYFVLTGQKGWLFDKILEEIQMADKYKEKIILTGYVDEKDLSPLYSGGLFFLYPSLYEGFGLPPLEAMKCGLPVIVSNTSSLPEVVGEAGILIDPLSETDFLKAFTELYNNKFLRDQLSIKGMKQADKFKWKNTVANILLAFNKEL